MEVNSFIEIIRYSRHQLDQVIEQIPVQDFSKSLTTGGWTVKDILAHITWYEKEMVTVTRMYTI